MLTALASRVPPPPRHHTRTETGLEEGRERHSIRVRTEREGETDPSSEDRGEKTEPERENARNTDRGRDFRRGTDDVQ